MDASEVNDRNYNINDNSTAENTYTYSGCLPEPGDKLRHDTDTAANITISQNISELHLLYDLIVIATRKQVDHRTLLKVFIESVCKRCGWHAGHVYFPSGDNKETIWNSSLCFSNISNARGGILGQNAGVNIIAATGLPGRVMASRTLESADYRSDKEAFIHLTGKENNNISKAIAAPVIVENEIFSIVEFFTFDYAGDTTSPSGSDIIRSAAVYLGNSIEHQLSVGRLEDNNTILQTTIYKLKKADSSLKLAEQRNRELMEASHIIPWEMDMDTLELTYLGPQASATSGYPQDVCMKKGFWLSCIHAEDLPYVTEVYKGLAHGHRDPGESTEIEYRFRLANGEFNWYRDIITFDYRNDGNNKLRGTCINITNSKQLELALKKEKEEQQKLINQLKAAQGQLLQSEKMASIGQLAAGVAHEINNPIGYVNSNLDSLELYVQNLLEITTAYESLEHLLAVHGDRNGELQQLKQKCDLEYLKEDVIALINESKEGLTRVKQIVQDLKSFSHVGDETWALADINSAIDSTLNIVNNEIKYKASVIREYGELPEVECVIAQLNQVFMNILVNASHAIDDKGIITIRTSTLNDQVKIEVTDTGRGIAPEHINKLFDPFFTTKPVGKGTGLGLSLSYGIIEKHHGKILVESTVGQGTTFSILIPVRRYADQTDESACESAVI